VSYRFENQLAVRQSFHLALVVLPFSFLDKVDFDHSGFNPSDPRNP
jgi:hypothetical protein